MPTAGFTRRGWVYAQAFEILIAFFALIAAISYLIYPEDRAQTPVGRTFHPYDLVWNLGYGLAGLLIVVGILRLRPRIEAGGLVLLAAAVAINTVAVIYVGQARGGFTIATFIAIVCACAARLQTLFAASKP